MDEGTIFFFWFGCILGNEAFVGKSLKLGDFDQFPFKVDTILVSFCLVTRKLSLTFPLPFSNKWVLYFLPTFCF